jgi:dTDP-4-amino-4,6-dideoxygalactose transaminase
MTQHLAMTGGDPVWTESWPAWPQAGPDTAARLADVLHSGRWAVSGAWTGRPPREAELAERFAAFVGSRWCIPVDHGSSALLASLHALEIGPGCEVIVPGLTWVACASVVARAGAVPILVDVDPRTLCLDPEAVTAAISPATAAIIVVHLYSAMADMDALRSLAERHHLPIIEDSAQSYGATWRGKGAGSLGIVGAFSAQQGKTLTSGEGGLFVTSDAALRSRVEMLRGDGRRYAAPAVPNMHMTEFQAELLLDGLERLPGQNAQRARAAALLDRELVEEADDLEPIQPHPQNDNRAFYHYAIRLRDGAFAGRNAATICEALSAELGYWVHAPYRPLDDHPLYDPRRLPRCAASGLDKELDPKRFHLPVAHAESARTILLHHPMLLGDERQLSAIVEAFRKVRGLAHRLPAPSEGVS